MINETLPDLAKVPPFQRPLDAGVRPLRIAAVHGKSSAFCHRQTEGWDMDKSKFLVLGGSLLASAAMLTAPAMAASKTAQPSNQELLERIERLEGDLRVEKKAREEDQAAQEKTSKGGWWANTKISGRMYYDITYKNNKDQNGASADDTGVAFDIKRFYIGIDHKFNDTFSANVTTDFSYVSGEKLTQVYIKKAYLQAKVNDALVFRLGSTDLPWVPFVEGIYGYRYVENVVVDRTKFGTSADWGVHVGGKLGNGVFNYAVAVINGAGYKNPVRTKGPDVEGRVSLNLGDFILGAGGYYGKLGAKHGTMTFHHATRFDALGAYKNDKVTVGVEYFHANDWMRVTSPISDESDGIGGFATYKFAPKWAIFGRYDWVRPTKDTNSDLKDDYYNVGISFSPAKIVDFALVYKHEQAENGSLSTSNGTIGSTVAGVDSGLYNEVGLWGRLRW